MKSLQEIWKKAKEWVKNWREKISFQWKRPEKGWYKLSDKTVKHVKRQRNAIVAYFVLVFVLIAVAIVGQNQRAERIIFEPLDSQVTGIEQEDNNNAIGDTEDLAQESLSQGALDLDFEKGNSIPTGQAEPLESFTWPVTGKITVRFHEVYNHQNQYRLHDGVDIGAASGQEVKAALGGIVEKVDMDPILGETVVLSHAGGVETIYGNLTGVQVLPGEKVEKGQIIAQVGDSARLDASQGEFLHFGLRLDGQYQDPQEYLP